MNKNIVHLSILSVVMMPLCAMSVEHAIDQVPVRCAQLLRHVVEQPTVAPERDVIIPRYYSLLPALGTCCGKRVLPLSDADVPLLSLCILLSANAFLYDRSSWMVAGQLQVELLLFDHFQMCSPERLQAGYESVVRELKTTWERTVIDRRRMFLPFVVEAFPDDWYFFYNKKTGCPGQRKYLKHVDQIIGATAKLFGLSSETFFCSEEWRGSCGWFPISPCASPVTCGDGQCYLGVHKDALAEFDRIFGFNLTALIVHR